MSDATEGKVAESERSVESPAFFSPKYARIVELVQLELDEKAFYNSILTLLPTPLTKRAAVWSRSDGCFVRASDTFLQTKIEISEQTRFRLLDRAFQTQKGEVFLKPDALGFDVAVIPVLTNEKVQSLIEVFIQENTNSSDLKCFLSELKVVAELASAYYARTEKSRPFLKYLSAILYSLEKENAALAISNEARGLLGCDRVTVFDHQNGKAIPVAVSGTSQINHRSNLSKALHELGQVLSRTNEDIWWPASRDGLPPQIESILDTYVDTAKSKSVGFLPLRRQFEDEEKDPVTVGYLLFEAFHTNWSRDPGFKSRAEKVARLTAIPFDNSRCFSRIPLRRVFAKPSSNSFFHSRKFVVLVLLVAAAMVLSIVRIPLSLAANGTLEPLEKHRIFAPLDGVIDEVHVDYGTDVRNGDKLVSLKNDDLDLEIRRTLGELDVVETKIASANAHRMIGTIDSRTTSATMLSSDEELLKVQVKSLQNQLSILRTKQALLCVRARHVGTVSTYRASEQLRNRPIHRGQQLLEIAELSGPWELELEIPDHYAGHILKQVNKGQEVKVTFVTAVAAERLFARLSQIEPVMVGSDGMQVLRARAEFDAEQIPIKRPGITVQAKLHCGNAPLGYAWFHGGIDFVRSKLLLYSPIQTGDR